MLAGAHTICCCCLLLLLLLLLGGAAGGGGARSIRYTPATRPPWLPLDLPWEPSLFSKAQARQLTLFYKHSAAELRALIARDVAAAERL